MKKGRKIYYHIWRRPRSSVKNSSFNYLWCGECERKKPKHQLVNEEIDIPSWHAGCYMRTQETILTMSVTARCIPTITLPNSNSSISWEAGTATSPGYNSLLKASLKAQMKPDPSLQPLWWSPGHCFLRKTLKLWWSSWIEGGGHHWDAPLGHPPVP